MDAVAAGCRSCRWAGLGPAGPGGPGRADRLLQRRTGRARRAGPGGQKHKLVAVNKRMLENIMIQRCQLIAISSNARIDPPGCWPEIGVRGRRAHPGAGGRGDAIRGRWSGAESRRGPGPPRARGRGTAGPRGPRATGQRGRPVGPRGCETGGRGPGGLEGRRAAASGGERGWEAGGRAGGGLRTGKQGGKKAERPGGPRPRPRSGGALG